MSERNADQPSNVESSPALKAAMALWEPLAAFAWDSYLVCGRGAIVLDQQALDEAMAQQAAGEPVRLGPGYAPLTDITPGDDFIQIIKTYDPEKQIVLIVGTGGEEDEQLFVIEAGEGGRPTPPECFQRRA